VQKVLNEGYLKVIETWGSDERIIEAARMSTDKGFLGWGPFDCLHCLHGIQDCDDGGPSITCEHCKGTGKIPGDEKLLAYLYNNHHMTPFEMAGMVIEVQAPIFVFREWHRHRTQSYNEMSARYTELPDLFYVPELGRIQKQSDKNKQGSGSSFSGSESEQIQRVLYGAYKDSRDAYEFLLEKGLTRELARLVIPVAQYSRMRASANLRNWLQFLTLRLAPGAQYEIRMYAQALLWELSLVFPRTIELVEKSLS
jgi:thymidylate synthase (FAD)